jgi:4-hydroxybenzoate polyprenyltransferase
MALVVVYPYMKRITYYPQITFGATFMWAIFMGYSAAAGSVDWLIATPLYFGGIAYGVMYDCIYAHQVRRSFTSHTSTLGSPRGSRKNSH